MPLVPCPECGQQVSDKAALCPKCGLDTPARPKRCAECGELLAKGETTCAECGCPVGQMPNGEFQKTKASPAAAVSGRMRERLRMWRVRRMRELRAASHRPLYAHELFSACLMWFFLGWAGVHRFYLGHTGIGIFQLMLNLFATPVVVYWSLYGFQSKHAEVAAFFMMLFPAFVWLVDLVLLVSGALRFARRT